METDGENTEKTPRLAPPWLPGQSGNPSGRPLGALGRRTIYQRALERKAVNGDGMRADEVARAIVEKAVNGDVSAAKEAFDSGYGKNADTLLGDPTQPLGFIATINHVRPGDVVKPDDQPAE